ncbi:MAG: phage tail sheath family protein, partial [Blastocatellia bacterium]
SVTVDHQTKDTTNTKQFNLTVAEIDPVTDQAVNIEKILNVSVDKADSRYVARVLNDDSMLVRVKKNNTGQWMVPNTRPSVVTDKKATADSGSDGAAIDQNDFTGTGKETAKAGLFALEKADLFNLLCIPPYKDDSNIDSDLVGKAAKYCEDRRAMLLVDPKREWDTVAEVIGNPTATPPTGIGAIGTSSKNAAFFFPRLRQPDPLRDNKLDDFVPCGAVAGIFARTDAQRGVWKAPAGLETSLVGVPQLTVSLTDAENGQLNPLGVNCLRTMPAAGRVVWGARTLQGNDRLASEWKYVPVRRTALFIEESLYRGLQWVVFEPNDEPLWAQIRLNVGAFMNTLFRQGAFQGSTPREAYFVKCDKETTTQNDIDRGIVNIVVGFAPLKPAEFVIIKLQQIAGQIQT